MYVQIILFSCLLTKITVKNKLRRNTNKNLQNSKSIMFIAFRGVSDIFSFNVLFLRVLIDIFLGVGKLFLTSHRFLMFMYPSFIFFEWN